MPQSFPSPHLLPLTLDSDRLTAPWAGPSRRTHYVWLPPQALDADGQPRRDVALPVLYDLAAYTSSGLAHIGWKNFGENLPARLERLVNSGAMKPAIVVFVDAFTSLGGNQYVNSSALGHWADYLLHDLVPAVEAQFPVLAGAAHRGLFGKSSGGYGAIHVACTQADHWGAIACHAGDCAFDLLYPPEFTACLDELAREAEPLDPAGLRAAIDAAQSGIDDGRAARFIERFQRQANVNGKEITALMVLAMAASYDPDPQTALGFRLPVNVISGECLAERWQHWLRFDPLNLVEWHADALKSLRGLWIDVGLYDQYRLLYGTRQLVARLQQQDIAHHYAEFEGSHSGIDYRLDLSLPYLVEALYR